MKLIEEELQYETENLGLVLDELGITPMAGRVLAYLMLSDPPHRSFDEIVDHLQASKSTISTSLKYLGQIDMIRYKTIPGDRRRYFSVAPDRWMAQINVHDKFRAMVGILNRVLEFRSVNDKDELASSLEEVRDMYLYFETEIPKMFERWEKIKKERREQLK